uniref:Trace amine-associated receptor 4-like n=1 Tax=Crocodylus porosus TaxID=8502 RepID=A0A7M4ED74_CROPO
MMNSSELWSPQTMQFCFDFVNNSGHRNVRTTLSLCAMYIFMGGETVFTLGGNMFVIISICHFKKLHSPTNFLICSMATTDFLLSTIVMPYSMVRSVESCWYFGEVFCKLHTCCDIMLCTTSIFHLCFISVDRHYAVLDPLHYVTKITIPVVEVFLLMSWCVPFIFAFGLVLSEMNTDGIGDYVASVDCSVLASLIAFFIPDTVMVGIYVHIFTVARKHFQTPRTKSLQKESKATKTLSIVIGVFVFSWLPFFALTITDPIGHWGEKKAFCNRLVGLMKDTTSAKSSKYYKSMCVQPKARIN